MAVIQDPRSGTADKANVEPTFKALRISPRPADVDGSYRISAKSGIIAAATAAGIQFSFKYGGIGVCLVQSIKIGINVLAAYTLGDISYGLYITRAYTTSDLTGGTLITLGNSNKLRDTMPSSQSVLYIPTTGNLSGGIGTDDLQPLAGSIFTLPAAITGQPAQSMLNFSPNSYPLILTQSEGFRIRSDTAYAATGTCNLVISVEWMERNPSVISSF